MSLEQSKKIVEAAGECWHEKVSETRDRERSNAKAWEPIVDLDVCACSMRFERYSASLINKGNRQPIALHCDTENPDLSRPENRHLLVGYVETICDTDRMKAHFLLGLQLVVLGGVPIIPEATTVQKFDVWSAPNEAIMTALCRVIEETK